MNDWADGKMTFTFQLCHLPTLANHQKEPQLSLLKTLKYGLNEKPLNFVGSFFILKYCTLICIYYCVFTDVLSNTKHEQYNVFKINMYQVVWKYFKAYYFKIRLFHYKNLCFLIMYSFIIHLALNIIITNHRSKLTLLTSFHKVKLNDVKKLRIVVIWFRK